MNGKEDICIDCAKMFGDTETKGLRGIGMWDGKCAICGEEKGLANAQHDFGLTDGQVTYIRAFIKDSKSRAKEVMGRMPWF